MNAEQRAAGLTDAQKSAIFSRFGPVDVIQSIEPYWFGFSEVRPGFFSIALKTLGLEVRAILEKQP